MEVQYSNRNTIQNVGLKYQMYIYCRYYEIIIYIKHF